MSALPEPWIVAQQEVEAACELLIDPSPPNLDRSAGILASAAKRLAETPAPAAHSRQLRASIHRAGRLLESAAQFHRGWRQILVAMTEGYTAEGGLAEPPPAARLSLDG